MDPHLLVKVVAPPVGADEGSLAYSLCPDYRKDAVVRQRMNHRSQVLDPEVSVGARWLEDSIIDWRVVSHRQFLLDKGGRDFQINRLVNGLFNRVLHHFRCETLLLLSILPDD